MFIVGNNHIAITNHVFKNFHGWQTAKNKLL